MRQDDFYNLIYQVVLVASSTEFFKILPRGIETILWDFIVPSFTIWSLYSPKILSKKLENKLMDLNWGKCHFEAFWAYFEYIHCIWKFFKIYWFYHLRQIIFISPMSHIQKKPVNIIDQNKFDRFSSNFTIKVSYNI